MRRRSPARWLAPLALITCAVAIYAVVDKELGSNASSNTTPSTRSTTGTAVGATSTAGKRKATKKATTYTVKAGDSLSVIAAKTNVDVTALQSANPNVDASALHPGQKLKLPR